jgi:hypothetical protein
MHRAALGGGMDGGAEAFVAIRPKFGFLEKGFVGHGAHL